MRKIILTIATLVIVFGGYVTYQLQKDDNQSVQVNTEDYQDLKDSCESNQFKECCLDSVKAMEVVGGTLRPSLGCDNNHKRMTLRCPGSYTWCQTSNDFDEDEDFVPVPTTEPIIAPGARIDLDSPDAVICTSDAKGCPDGTFVGRTGPNCEFAKCPGYKLKPDFVPTEANPIQLPDNVISIKNCEARGGEVWNTFGKTSYEGELIGRIEELLCPCACLVKTSEPDILWVTINGNKEEFAGNLNDIKTFYDCKNAGFPVYSAKDRNAEYCQVGEPHMTDGKYKTFKNNPIAAKKICTDYTYSNCPASCVATCTPSSCGEPWIEDGEEMRNCTSDCDGAGSCVGR